MRENQKQVSGVSETMQKQEHYVEMRLDAAHSMKITIGNIQNQGKREYQEDAFGYSNSIDSDVVSDSGLAAVLSDGMGGLSNGKLVADTVVSKVISMLPNINFAENIGKQMAKILWNISNEISAQFAQGSRSTAGATAVFFYLIKNRVFWACAGDSRLYCIRNHGIYQMNEDHDYKNKLLRRALNGDGKFSDAHHDPQKDSLTSFIGKPDFSLVDYSLQGIRVRPGDTFLLCSDGVYNTLGEQKMLQIVSSYKAQAAADMILHTVLSQNVRGQDNFTAMIIRCEKM